MSGDSAVHSPQPVVREQPVRTRPWTFTWWLAVFLLHPLMRLILRLRIEGRENLDPQNAQIIAANHSSHVDPVIVGYASGLETSFLAKDEVFKASPFLAWLISKYHSYPVNRGAGDVGALRKCSELLGEKQTLALFPEGTRSKSGTLQALRPGVAMLSIMNGVPIVPTFISGVRRTIVPWLVDPDIVRYHKRAVTGEPALSPFARFRIATLWAPRVRVVFGRPIRPDGFQRTKEDYRTLTEQLQTVMLQKQAAGAEPRVCTGKERHGRTQNEQ
jgi:1-acyl-sn-glycerol-3-phosphate acyltransferase